MRTFIIIAALAATAWGQAPKNESLIDKPLNHVIGKLVSREVSERYEAAVELACRGEAATTALPALTHASQKDTDETVRVAAGIAVRIIGRAVADKADRDRAQKRAEIEAAKANTDNQKADSEPDLPGVAVKAGAGEPGFSVRSSVERLSNGTAAWSWWTILNESNEALAIYRVVFNNEWTAVATSSTTDYGIADLKQRPPFKLRIGEHQAFLQYCVATGQAPYSYRASVIYVDIYTNRGLFRYKVGAGFGAVPANHRPPPATRYDTSKTNENDAIFKIIKDTADSGAKKVEGRKPSDSKAKADSENEPRYKNRPASAWLVSLKRRDRSENYFEALTAAVALREHIYKDAVPVIVDQLVQELKHGDTLRTGTAERTALHDMLPESQIAAARLGALLLSVKETRHKEKLAELLGDFGAGAAPAVPALTKTLRHDEPTVVYLAARALGNCGEAAKSALPELRRLSQDADARLSRAAADAIRRIEAKP